MNHRSPAEVASFPNCKSTSRMVPVGNFSIPEISSASTNETRFSHRQSIQSDIITAAVLAGAGRFAPLLLLYCQRLTDAYQPRIPNSDQGDCKDFDEMPYKGRLE
jgi:hypothetical protein